eukprot:Em0017g850a
MMLASRLEVSPTAIGRTSRGQFGLFFSKATRLPPAINFATETGTLPERSRFTISLRLHKLETALGCQLPQSNAECEVLMDHKLCLLEKNARSLSSQSLDGGEVVLKV